MLAVSEVTKGVHLIDTYANAYLLTDQRLVLVDTSSETHPQKIFDALDRLRVQPGDLTSILITHTHPDHVTGLAAIRRRYPAKVAAHEIEAPFVAKEKTYTGPPGAQYQRHAGTPVDVKLKDGAVHDGLQVIHTPGHTLGSMSLLDRERRVLVAGDAVRTETGRVGPMEDVYNVDPKAHRASIKRLAEFDFDVLVCGHGPPIVRDAAAQVQALARTFT